MMSRAQYIIIALHYLQDIDFLLKTTWEIEIFLEGMTVVDSIQRGMHHDKHLNQCLMVPEQIHRHMEQPHAASDYQIDHIFAYSTHHDMCLQDLEQTNRHKVHHICSQDTRK